MKIRASFILLGAMLLLVAYSCLQFSFPWLTLTPFPTLTVVKPLEPLAFILGSIGIIAIIFGLTENAMVRLLICILALGFLAMYLKGWLNLEQIWHLIQGTPL